MNTIVRIKREATEKPGSGPTGAMIGVYSLIAIVVILIFAVAFYIVCVRCFRKKPSDLTQTQSIDTDMSTQSRLPSTRKKEPSGADDMQAMQHDLQRQALKKQNLDIEDIVKMQSPKSKKSKKK